MFPSKPCQLSFVIPIYNEAKRLPPSLEKLHGFSKTLKHSYEWIFVVEPSEDESLQIIENHCKKHENFRYIANEKQKGKGYAVQTGMLGARGEWVFFMDADLATPLKEIHHFLQQIEEQPETPIFIASRRLANSKIFPPATLVRKLFSICLNLLVKILGLSQHSDTQCGFKAFHKDSIPILFRHLYMQGFSFDIEVLIKAKQHKLACKEVAVEWSAREASSVRLFRDSLQFFQDLIRLRILY
tara:strand:- start:13394 stop:14119 length:726 start_codon:yes stop_codon:yes gene_type:complete